MRNEPIFEPSNLLARLVKNSRKSVYRISNETGVDIMTLYNAIDRGYASVSVLEVLSEYFGVDLTFLEKERSGRSIKESC